MGTSPTQQVVACAERVFTTCLKLVAGSPPLQASMQRHVAGPTVCIFSFFLQISTPLSQTGLGIVLSHRGSSATMDPVR